MSPDKRHAAGVIVGVTVGVMVKVGVIVCVTVLVTVCVTVLVTVCVTVGVTVCVTVCVTVLVTVCVDVGVNVNVGSNNSPCQTSNKSYPLAYPEKSTNLLNSKTPLASLRATGFVYDIFCNSQKTPSEDFQSCCSTCK